MSMRGLGAIDPCHHFFLFRHMNFMHVKQEKNIDRNQYALGVGGQRFTLSLTVKLLDSIDQ